MATLPHSPTLLPHSPTRVLQKKFACFFINFFFMLNFIILTKTIYDFNGNFLSFLMKKISASYLLRIFSGHEIYM